ncbi:MAG: peptidase C11 [Oscillospiraceae bacterium]|nr:peptidase C11 [Oscillospiraceae bacterium]
MAEQKRPRRRETFHTDDGKGVHLGEQVDTGKVGSGSGNPGAANTGSSTIKRASGGGLGLIVIIALALLLFRGGGLSSMLGGGGSSSGSLPQVSNVFTSETAASANSWGSDSNTGKLDTSVASGARAKYTTLKGNGQDTVTMMVYMCGTDLESKYGMATNDLMEMANATIGSNVNIIAYTGGCKKWNNSIVSSSTNQIYKIESGGLRCVYQNAGSPAMTDPNTLQSFITWCKQSYPANRNILIFWDHGGGSLSGYGYDEKNPRAGSMTLAQIDQALKGANMKFDLIGFDTCLMATVENAMMLSKYADYMVASEETEPGVGWYYTNWVTALSKNTSISTLDLGKKIVDDFVDVCAQQCRGQQTTLSLVDLAELSQTMNTSFATFSTETKNMIANDGYKTVSAARSATREFAGSSSIDQIDLVHFAKNLNTKESKELADVLLNAIKYNRTGNITNAYGLSIYFPYKKVSGVDQAVATYNSIGLDSKYSECIREFASLGAYGQAAAGGTGSALPSLLGSLGGSGSSSGGQDLAQLLNLFMSGSGGRSVAGLTDENTAFLSERSMSMEDTAAYIEANRFDPANLVWTAHDGHQKIVLEQDQWDLVQGLDLNMFYDDGAGYVDLGLDNVFDFDEYGQLIGDTDGSWLSINGQPVAYYHLSTSEEDGDHYTITGRVPVLLNGEQMDLILIFTDEDPQGYIAGARPAYTEDETETVARGLAEVKPGDMLEFLCDYYSYEGVYQATYKLGSPMTVKEDMVISNTDLGGDYVALYRIMDIYGQYYWTLPVPQN